MADAETDATRLRAALDALIADLAHFAQILHQSYHDKGGGTWEGCDRGVCSGIQRSIARAREVAQIPHQDSDNGQ